MRIVYSMPASPTWRAWPSRIDSCRAMKAKMLCTSLRKSRSVPSLRSSGRVTVSGSPPRALAGSARRGVCCPRSALTFWRDTCVLRIISLWEALPDFRVWQNQFEYLCDGSSHHRQDVNIVSMPERAIEHRIGELHFEAARGTNPADRRERSAKHDGARRKQRAIPRNQISRRAHRAEQTFLIGRAAAVDRRKGPQLQTIPVIGDIVQQPQVTPNRLGTELF